MEKITEKKYRPVDGLDKLYKPLIIKWLCKQFNYQYYPHSFKDQWILWSIWEGMLTISFDGRQDEHNKLLSLIHPRFLGIPQYKTLKIVNEKNFYLQLNHLLNIDYPAIVGHELLSTEKHKDDDGDVFYTYKWNVFLADGTSVIYNNMVDKMDLIKSDFVYNKIIQERAFTEFLKQQ